jgi:hypothetical protein
VRGASPFAWGTADEGMVIEAKRQTGETIPRLQPHASPVRCGEMPKDCGESHQFPRRRVQAMVMGDGPVVRPARRNRG